jgi:hypothetical protein
LDEFPDASSSTVTRLSLHCYCGYCEPMSQQRGITGETMVLLVGRKDGSVSICEDHRAQEMNLGQEDDQPQAAGESLGEL